MRLTKADLDQRLRQSPWYRQKATISYADMLAALRRELIRHEFWAQAPPATTNPKRTQPQSPPVSRPPEITKVEDYLIATSEVHSVRHRFRWPSIGSGSKSKPRSCRRVPGAACPDQPPARRPSKASGALGWESLTGFEEVIRLTADARSRRRLPIAHVTRRSRLPAGNLTWRQSARGCGSLRDDTVPVPAVSRLPIDVRPQTCGGHRRVPRAPRSDPSTGGIQPNFWGRPSIPPGFAASHRKSSGCGRCR